MRTKTILALTVVTAMALAAYYVHSRRERQGVSGVGSPVSESIPASHSVAPRNREPHRKAMHDRKLRAPLAPQLKSRSQKARGPMPKDGLNVMAGALKHLMKDDGPTTAALIPTVMNVLYGRTGALENALDTGLSPNVIVWLGQEGGNTSLLCFAVDAGQRGSIKALVEDGAYVNPSQFGQPGAPFCSPLAEAAIGAEDDVVKYLLASGANIEQKTPSGATALAQAVKFGNYSTVMLLLKHGAKISSALGSGNVVSKQLVESTDPRYVAIRKLLIAHGAKMPTAH